MVARLLRRIVRAVDRGRGGAACRVCGCTDNAACPGGCFWVESDLCSSCTDVISVSVSDFVKHGAYVDGDGVTRIGIPPWA